MKGAHSFFSERLDGTNMYSNYIGKYVIQLLLSMLCIVICSISQHGTTAELANSIENTIAIAFLSTIAIAIAIDKAIFQLLLLLLLLIRASSNYWHFNRNYCFRVLPLIWPFLVSKYTLWSLMHSRLNKNACFIQILLVRHISAAETALLLLNYYCYWPFLALLLLILLLLRRFSNYCYCYWYC